MQALFLSADADGLALALAGQRAVAAAIAGPVLVDPARGDRLCGQLLAPRPAEAAMTKPTNTGGTVNTTSVRA